MEYALFALLSGVLAVVAVAGGRRIWRFTESDVEEFSRVLPSGVGRNWVRAVPFMAGVAPLMPLLVIFVDLFPDPNPEAAGLAVPVWVLIVTLALTVGPAVTGLLIILINRPRMLVPPALREQPGLFQRTRPPSAPIPRPPGAATPPLPPAPPTNRQE